MRPSPPVAVAIALPLLLAVAVAVIGISGRFSDGPAPPETSPLAVATVDAPQAGAQACTTVLASLDGDLPAGDRTLPSRPLADPRPPGVRAWAASPRPVVLRCGLPRPAELTPASSLLVIDGVQWLALDDGLPQPELVTYVAVDRPVFVALTVPTGLGSGPVQAVSDVLRDRLAAVPVPVR